MLSKTLFVAFAALATVSRAATPPGCLLGAVNQYSDPADIKTVCSSKDATQKIAKMCGSATQDALSSFADLCNAAGVKVDTTVPTTGSASPSATGSASGNSTSSGLAVATSVGASKTPSASSPTGAPQHTGAAGKLEMGTAALIAGLGVFAAVL